MLTNVYELTETGLVFLGQTDAAMYETVNLNSDRIRMIRLDDTGNEGIPIPVYGLYRIGNDGMPVCFETIEQ